MRIHTSVTRPTIIAAARLARVDLVTLEEHESATHPRAFDVKLQGESRRRPAGGSSTGYAATWDQWGVFLAAIYAEDYDARCGGTAKRPVYANAGDFDYQTGFRFADDSGDVEPGDFWPADAHGDHTFRFAGVPFSQQCTKCSAVKRWR
jgi:hypothetical protein